MKKTFAADFVDKRRSGKEEQLAIGRWQLALVF
jgi:hypothetical protein